MKLLKNSIPASLFVATAMMTAGLGSANAADKYLESVEERLERVERELRIIKSDAKGKDVLSAEVPVFVKPKSKYVEEIKLRGRLQTQYGYVSPAGNSTSNTAGTPTSVNTFQLRRARFGAEGKLANDFKFLVELNALPATGSVLNAAFLQYTAYDYFQPLAGYYKPTYGFEENTSSAAILTIERSNLTNNLAVNERVGAGIYGEYSFLSYAANVFDNTANGVNFQAGAGGQYAWNTSVGMDFSEMLGFKLESRFDYLNVANPTTFGRGASTAGVHNIAASLATGFGGFDLVTEFMWSKDSNNTALGGNNASSIYGAYVMPSYYIIPKKLQAVARYTYMGGDDGGNFTMQGGGSSSGTPIGPFDLGGGYSLRGDLYNAVYGGLNYYINGNDLKLMAGVEWSNLQRGGNGVVGNANRFRQSVTGVTFWTGVRMQF